MSAVSRFLPPERRTLVADALLLTTATSGAVLGLTTLLEEAVGDTGWYPWVSSLALVGVVLVCPYVVWRLHGHRGTTSSALGAGAGLLGGGGLLWGGVMAVGVVSLAASWVSGGRVSQGAAALVLLVVLLAALLVALDVDAVRDLVRSRVHVGTDAARLLATLLATGTAAGAVWYALANPGQEPAELLAFGLAAGVVGAAVVLGADLAGSLGTAPAAPASR